MGWELLLQVESAGLVESRSPGLHRFAVFTACAALAMVFVGGLVTSSHSALAVPDWPLAFGKVVPPAFTEGVRFNYDHRLAAMVVMVLALALVTWTFASEPRRWVRNTALAALGLVIVQALVGATIVLRRVPLPVAVVHTAAAQAFFCLTVAVAAFTSPWFITVEPRKEPRAGIRFTALCAVTTAVIDLHLLVCAVMKHAGAGGAIPDYPTVFGGVIPPAWDIYIALNFAHRLGALVVTCFVAWTLVRALREHREERAVRRPAEGLALLLLVQILLGGVTVLSGRALLLTTAHDVLAAGVLATSFLLTIRAWRLYRVPGAASEGAAWRPARAADGGAERVTA